MPKDLIHDRGRGPEIVGTRITVYNLLPYFLDPAVTEAAVGQMYQLSPEQVAAARAYVFHHLDTVLPEHIRLETRMAAGNSPEIVERMKRTHEKFVRFKEWFAERERARSSQPAATPEAVSGSSRFPTFDEWLAERGPQSGIGT
jgi:uncharacterized protein (DUF433 family)